MASFRDKNSELLALSELSIERSPNPLIYLSLEIADPKISSDNGGIS